MVGSSQWHPSQSSIEWSVGSVSTLVLAVAVMLVAVLVLAVVLVFFGSHRVPVRGTYTGVHPVSSPLQ